MMTEERTNGQGETFKDKEGNNDLLMTEGGTDNDNEGHTGTRTGVVT